MRILNYLLLGILVIATPYLMTMIFIIITGDRYEGMLQAVTPGLISAQLIFGLIVIQKPWLKRIPITIVMTALSYGLVLIIIKSELIKTSFDLYGFWDLAVTNLVAGLIIWELFYQIDSAISKRIAPINTKSK